MKIGAENRKKVWAAAILLVLALLMFLRMLVSDANTSSASTQVPPSPATPAAIHQARRARPRPERKPMVLADNLDPRLRLDLLKESETTTYAGNGRNIFRGYELEEIPKPKFPPRTTPQPPAPPVATGPPPPPPINLKFFGFASQSGDKSVFLSDGDVVFVAKVGDIVNRRYRVMKINATDVEILDVLNNHQQTIHLQPGAGS